MSVPSHVATFIQLEPDVANKIEKSVSQIRGSPYEDVEAYLSSLHSSFVSHLPGNILHEIRVFREDPAAPGALILKGLPLDPSLSPTPSDGDRSKEKSTFISEASLLGLSLLFGEVYGLKQVKKGEIVQTVAPVESKFASQSNEGYGSELKMHTEMSFHPTFRPHYFMLLCLREDKYKESLTYVSDNKDVVSQLTVEEAKNLRNDQFRVHGPETFRAFWTPVNKAIIIGTEAAPEVVLGLHAEVDAPTPECAQALTHIKELIQSNKHGIHLTPGDCLIVDNRKVMHGRSPFRSEFDGGDRWLQRVHIRQAGTLWKAQSSAKFPSRVFDGFAI